MGEILPKGDLKMEEHENINKMGLAENASSLEKGNEDRISLKLENVHKFYGKKEALKGIYLELHVGEVFGLVGANGSGKTTLLDLTVGLKDLDAGRIYIQEMSLEKKPMECKRHLGYVASEGITYEFMTGLEYLEFIASGHEMYQEHFDQNLDFLKKKLHVSDEDLCRWIQEDAPDLQKKLSLMASLIYHPDIWILDNPTLHLDIMTYPVVTEMVRDYARHGKTVLLASDNIDFVAQVCDRVAIMEDGLIKDVLRIANDPMRRQTLAKHLYEMDKVS